jgi:type II secretory pathway component PulF
MLLGTRASLKELAQLCRRLATSLEAGIDARRTWAREAEGRTSASLRRRLYPIHEAVRVGRSVTDGLADTGEYFPPMFREMVHVGEQTGKLAEVFRQLADHYDHQLTLRRAFLAAIAWPMLQLIGALTVIGIVILVLGFLPLGEGGKPIDTLGLGLIGVPGFVIYVLFLGTIAAALYLLYLSVQLGMLWTRPLQRALLQTPGLGGCLQTLALARLAWSLNVTMETGMDLRHAMALSLGSTHNARYTDHTERVVTQVARGHEIHETFAETGVFPREFLDTLEVGERSGRLPESMAILASQYQEQARRTLTTLTVLAGFAVWGLVALIIIVMIFQVFSFYLNVLNDAGKM